jgi:hypothetical protein
MVYSTVYRGGWRLGLADYLIKSSFKNGIEIIGNIHDNPGIVRVLEMEESRRKADRGD